jgi:hypothetical protein
MQKSVKLLPLSRLSPDKGGPENKLWLRKLSKEEIT